MSTTPEDFLQNATVEKFPLEFGKLKLDDISAWKEPIERECFVEQLIPKGELVCIYGNPKDGKSHGLTFILYRASLGLGSFGLTAIPCTVVYLALEGGHGFRNRVLALSRRFGASHRFFPMRQPMNFLDDKGGIQNLIEALRAVRADVVVVDTVTRAIPGGEQNGPEAFSKLVGIIDNIRSQTGVCAVLVHHAGVSGRMLGSTVLPGALDVLCQVTHEKATGIRTLKIEDSRDGEAGLKINYRIESFELGTGRKGNPITIGTVVEIEQAEDSAATVSKHATDLTPTQKKRLSVIHDMLADVRYRTDDLKPHENMPRVSAVRRDELRRQYQRKEMFEGDPDQPMSENVRQKLRQTLNSLRDKAVIEFNEHWVWLT